ncbi:MAG: TonB-dependent receptor plug domain-containing protein [Gammaproteobacteria bacterium]|nr:TonB-dependent receptor plug domain-containing protein [Gammaproteobacteria bacterium]MXY89773.1 TonB-dependent receptor plug domain-containing protein [Gammaproteobacteria bacterium]MYE28347.1 TonB-dependent receptor plug domain-containing protein [Gammaproteobacteria bacterium]MYG96645.1 TonB-dependent receptor plug domain-containing protein [Gammaproteobacteria bacterium]
MTAIKSDPVRGAVSALFFFLLSAGSAVGQDDGADSGEESTVNYPAAYFSQFNPVSVDDMLSRIPGINLVLDASRGGFSNFNQQDRGLGGSSQILIDGKRLAGKVNEAREQLARIAAEEVEYIEIIRGTSSGLDVQNVGQVVNVVLKRAASRSSVSAQAGMQRYRDGNVEPVASVSLTGQRDNLNYLFSLSGQSNYRAEESLEVSTHGDGALNEIIAFERTADQNPYRFNTSLTWDIGSADRIAINALYNRNDPPSSLLRSITDYNGPAPATTWERENVPATQSNWELGGDYEHIFLDGSRYKLLFIVNDRDNDILRERWEFDSPGEEERKNLYLHNASSYQEQIVRTSYTFSFGEGQGLELGVEGAHTTQDTSLRLGRPLPGPPDPEVGGLFRIPVPNAVSTVSEDRYETFAIHNWRLNPRMRLESSLVGEFSEISQTGDVDNSRDFRFLKPKVDFRFDINPSLQLQASIEKVVSQLSFADFSANTNQRDEDQDTIAGNPELEQEQTWQYNVNVDYRLPNDGGVLSSRLFYYDVGNSIGRIELFNPGPQLAATNGNVGDGSVLGFNFDASVRFGFLGLPQALATFGLLLQDSAIDDPLIGFERKVVPYDRGSFNIGFRHDVSSLGLNYGFNYRDRIDGNRTLFDIDNVLYLNSQSDLTVFVEKSGIAGLTFRLEARNLLDHVERRTRFRYFGYLRDQMLRETENFAVTPGLQFAFSVRGNF